MPYMERKGARIYFETQGEGPPLFLISGLSGGCWSWFGQTPYFQQRYRVILMDNRGAGRSTSASDFYEMKDFAEDIVDLLDWLKIRRTFALGISMGGMIAQELALMAPDRLAAMVLACTHCGGTVRIPPSPEALHTLIQNEGLSREQIVRKNLPLFFSPSFLNSNPREVDRYCEVQIHAPPQTEAAFQAQLQAIGNFDSHDRLIEIRTPTLILSGTEDILVPAGNARILQARIRGSELLEIQGAGHALHVECRDRLNELSDRFFSLHRGEA